MAQRKSKHSRRQAIAHRRWKDLQDAKQAKYTGPWKRRDRRPAAFQTMKDRFRIVQEYRRLCAGGMTKGEAAQQTAKAHGLSASTVARLKNADELRLSGLAWPETRARWANTAYCTRESSGRGQVILFADYPYIRSYFNGSKRLFVNAVLLGPGMGARWPAPY